MIVLDAAAILELLLATPRAPAVAARLASPAETLHAPHLIDLEVAQVLRRYVLAGALASDRAALALADFGELELTRYPHDVLLPRIWQLHVNLTAYDAAYVALAEALGAPLLTTDARLARSSGHGAAIELA
jgi:predicted nucleic acid-binding protein